MDTFKLFINPKTRNAPLEEKVFEKSSQIERVEKDKAGDEQRAKEKEENDKADAEQRTKESEAEKLKVRFKEYGSNITFTSVPSKPTKQSLKETEKVLKNQKKEEMKDELIWREHPLLPKGWRVAPLLLQQPRNPQLLPGLKVRVE